jgi:predicted nucleic acid-binding protein
VILIDTTPLVALCDTRDSLHRAAWRHLAGLSRETFGICEAALTEACFHLSDRRRRGRLRRLLEELNASALTLDGEGVPWSDVFDWIDKYADHDPDWADGYIAALCGRDRSLKVWTYDAEFRTTWRRPDGSAIPLAVRL